MDPFMYLTVPLPIAQYREFKYHFVPRDPEKPIMRGKVLVPANASFSQVKEKLGILMKCSPQHVSSAAVRSEAKKSSLRSVNRFRPVEERHL